MGFNEEVRPKIGRWLLALPLIVLALFVAACGDDDESGSGSSGANNAPADTSGVDEAKEFIDGLKQRPTEIPIKEPIEKPIPTGKKIDYVVCPAPGCVRLKDKFTEAAEILGWEVKEVTAGTSAGEVQATWEQVVRDAPDGVVYSGLDRDQFEPQLKKLEDAGIPVVSCCTDDPEGGALEMVNQTPEDQAIQGKMLAAWATAESEGTANTVMMTLPAFTILQGQLETFKTEYERLCPDCGFDELEIPIQEVGKDVPNRLVSYLRSNPDVDYVLAQQDVLLLGVPAALRSAGLLDRVKIMGQTPDPQNIQYIANGEVDATIAFPIEEQSYSWADALARIFVGESVDASRPPADYQLLTQDNLESESELWPLVEDYQAQFKELWNK